MENIENESPPWDENGKSNENDQSIDVNGENYIHFDDFFEIIKESPPYVKVWESEENDETIDGNGDNDRNSDDSFGIIKESPPWVKIWETDGNDQSSNGNSDNDKNYDDCFDIIEESPPWAKIWESEENETIDGNGDNDRNSDDSIGRNKGLPGSLEKCKNTENSIVSESDMPKCLNPDEYILKTDSNVSNDPTVSEFVSDFDQMLTRKKTENRRPRNRGKNRFVDYYIEVAVQLVSKMTKALVDDRKLALEHKPAINKIAMLKEVLEKTNLVNIHRTFIENDILDVFAEWLISLPNKALPCYQIRHGIMTILDSFPPIDDDLLIKSKIKDAVEYYYNNTEEDTGVRKIAKNILIKWQNNVGCKILEERRSRDLALLQSEHKSTTSTEEVSAPKKSLDVEQFENADLIKAELHKRSRARVPMTSTKTYYLRPQSKITTPFVPHKLLTKKRR